MSLGRVGAVLVCLLYVATGLRLQTAQGETGEKKKYAYVTMAFNPGLLSDEDFEKLKGPVAPGKAVNPFRQHYVDVTLDRDEAEEDPAKHKAQREKGPRGRGGKDGFKAPEFMARGLREVGAEYPLLALTNLEDKLTEGVNASHPNLIPVDMRDFFWNRTCKSTAATGYYVAIQKILLFKLYDYDRLIWLDTDVTINENPDYLFESGPREGVVGMLNDPWCDTTPDYDQPERAKTRMNEGVTADEHHDFLYRNSTFHDFATSIMAVTPNKDDWEGITALARELEFCGNDQDLIAEHFWRKSRTKDHELLTFFTAHDALWGRCANPRFQKTKSHPTLTHKINAKDWRMR